MVYSNIIAIGKLWQCLRHFPLRLLPKVCFPLVCLCNPHPCFLICLRVVHQVIWDQLYHVGQKPTSRFTRHFLSLTTLPRLLYCSPTITRPDTLAPVYELVIANVRIVWAEAKFYGCNNTPPGVEDYFWCAGCG